MSISDELEKLHRLYQEGGLTEAEYDRAKRSLLQGEAEPGAESGGRRTTRKSDRDADTWGTFIHLSQFAGYLVPLLGLALPIVLWQVLKDDHPVLDHHGRVVVNWILTELILLVVGLVLAFFLIGIPILIIVGILGIVFPIIGAVKASSGNVWAYPMAISFFPDTPVDAGPVGRPARPDRAGFERDAPMDADGGGGGGPDF